jgi:hypothetical protein
VQAEERQPLAPVTGCQFQAGGDEILEGLNVARCEDVVHPQRRRFDRFRRASGKVIHGAPPARHTRRSIQHPSRGCDRPECGGGRLRASVAADVRSRVRSHHERCDAFFGWMGSADFPERDQT